MRRIVWMIVVVLALVGAMLAQTLPASAAQTSAGQLEFSGSAFLPAVPCPLGQVCNGSFVGTVNGTVAGVSETIPWTATLALAPLSATFAYQDTCPLPIGLASGTATISMSLGGAPVGTYGPIPGSLALPLPVISVLMPVAFSWTRVGLAAGISTSTDIKLLVQGPGPTTQWIQVATGHTGVAVASFVPTQTPALCPDQGPLSALIVGTETIPS